MAVDLNNISGLIRSVPHNENYTEIKTKLEQAQGDITNLNVNKAESSNVYTKSEIDNLQASNINNDASGVDGVKVSNALVGLKLNIDNVEDDVNTLKNYGNVITINTSGDILASYSNKFLKCIGTTYLTIQPNSIIPIDIGTEILICQYGANDVVIVEGIGVTVNSTYNTLTLNGAYSYMGIKKMDTDEWLLVGETINCTE